MKKKTIFFVTSSRSEYYLIKPLLKIIKKKDNFNLKIVVCGGHNDRSYGNTINAIIEDKFKFIKKIKNYSKRADLGTIEKSFLKLSKELINIFREEKKFILLVLGDRYEAFCASNVANLMKMPIIHISGGDTSLGSNDEKYRNMISLISKLHFCKTEKHKKKLQNFKIKKDHIHVIGSLALDNLKKISKKNHFKKYKSYCLASVHSTTETIKKNLETVYLFISLVKKLKKINFIFTSASHDQFGIMINKILLEASKKYKNCFFFHKKRKKKYLNAIQNSKFMIGNSSSGIIESSFFSKPSISILPRQLGRQANRNVFFVEKSEKKILKTLQKIKLKNYKIALKNNIFDMQKKIGSPSQYIYKNILKLKYD